VKARCGPATRHDAWRAICVTASCGALRAAALALVALLGPVLAGRADVARATELPAVKVEPGIPDDAALEAEGARIGRIEFVIGNVFDPTVRAENNPLYRLANTLHVRTRESTLRAQLLFRSGDPYSRRVLDETERALRTQRYLGDAMVVPVRYARGVVDVAVVTRDTWTFSPGISFGRKGGANSTSFELQETNVLGRGKSLALERSDDVDRTSYRVQWTDPNVWGSRWQMFAQLQDNSDGMRHSLALDRPFFALDTRWSAGASFDRYDRFESRYALGELVDQFRRDQKSIQVYGGRSTGLRNGWVRRWQVGFQYDQNAFAAVTPPPAVPAAPRPRGVGIVPADRTLSYPWAAVEWVQDDFLKSSNLGQIGRTEDIAVGRSARLLIGYSSTSLGATTDAVMLSGRLAQGFRPTPAQLLLASVAASGRLQGGSTRDVRSQATVRWYARTAEWSTFYASADVLQTHALDPDQQLLLGGEEGLRGYPLRYQTGSGRALVTVEQRFFTQWYPFRLAHVGAAAFADAGRTWGQGPVEARNLGWLTNVGIGLRLGLTRSGLGNVLHVDVATPLQRTGGIDAVQFSVSTKASF